MAAFTSCICAGNNASVLDLWLIEATANPASTSGLISDFLIYFEAPP